MAQANSEVATSNDSNQYRSQNQEWLRPEWKWLPVMAKANMEVATSNNSGQDGSGNLQMAQAHTKVATSNDSEQ